MDSDVYAPGTRVVIRDAEWVIRRADRAPDGGQRLVCDGVSELVRGHEAVFLTTIERGIQVLDPAETALVPDRSSRFIDSLLYMESQLRQAVPSDETIHVGHQAAMDTAPYQQDPARQALRQPRQRVLIADAVGLGKTLEAGILVSELIARGRGRRILVLAVKSMLTQFQKEFWNRFTIPLTRLDSVGIQRVRGQIPTNHNPFYYYDKSIISIDTLKQDAEYRTYLERAYWDIIVIDEAHNVADRGSGSLRSRLAKLLAQRSDTLIMLSATPHDGKARSFASLMNMLDATAIADPDNYGKDDFSAKGLVIRRFKKDIQDQVQDAFRDRVTHQTTFQASTADEAAFEALLEVKVAGTAPTRRDLFAVTLEKALFSSPAACLETVEKRIRRREAELAQRDRPEAKAEVASLRGLRTKLLAIDIANNARYQALLQAIQAGPFHWKGRDPDDRIVVFTERIETLKWLAQQLAADLKLGAGRIQTLHGGMSDTEQQQIVEDFGSRENRVRLLVCSDVASEGINLHFRSHRLIHYDMPWSLMVFQQRNGRIDRFGQEQTPEIVYLVCESGNETIRGDLRILEVLREKDEQAYRNIGDPTAFMNAHDIEEEEKLTSRAIASGTEAEAFSESLNPKANEGDRLLAMFLGTDTAKPEPEDRSGLGTPTNGASSSKPPRSLFPSDLSYAEQSLYRLRRRDQNLFFEVDHKAGLLTLDAPSDLRHRFGYFPQEVKPPHWRFRLTSDKSRVRAAIKESREREANWPAVHYLWRQNPVIGWLNDRMLTVFGRHQAPILAGVPGLGGNEVAFALCGIVPNRKSHPLVYEWVAIHFVDGEFTEHSSFDELLERTRIASDALANQGQDIDVQAIRKLLPEAVKRARELVEEVLERFDDEVNAKLDKEVVELDILRDRQLAQVDRMLEESRQAEAIKRARADRKKREIETMFQNYFDWVQETMTIEKHPWIKVMCAMTGRA